MTCYRSETRSATTGRSPAHALWVTRLGLGDQYLWVSMLRDLNEMIEVGIGKWLLFILLMLVLTGLETAAAASQLRIPWAAMSGWCLAALWAAIWLYAHRAGRSMRQKFGLARVTSTEAGDFQRLIEREKAEDEREAGEAQSMRGAGIQKLEERADRMRR
jgi:hypothetical protein